MLDDNGDLGWIKDYLKSILFLSYGLKELFCAMLMFVAENINRDHMQLHHIDN